MPEHPRHTISGAVNEQGRSPETCHVSAPRVSAYWNKPSLAAVSSFNHHNSLTFLSEIFAFDISFFGTLPDYNQQDCEVVPFFVLGSSWPSGAPRRYATLSLAL
jgi:hypothetical protein